ncbi:alpha/beta hydrolase [Streptomyces sp. NBC_01296]|uniref:alpha/beta hydrolase n=1 Tax=Streptomyces sp. NBC_01296 TaxID=2903816 RepID=UPI002E0FBCDD|nr:alpha/beta hydrolase [Streptomyces sp. NBC_01296]
MPGPGPGPTSDRSRRGAAAALAVTAALCSTVLAAPALASATAPATAYGSPSPPSPSPGVPRLDWSPCAPGSPYDCATARVPLDHADPAGRTIDLAVVRRKASDTAHRIGTLFVNPGGPGGPGTVQVPQNYDSFPKTVRERFDIVSWDPRGIGNSTAVNCFDDAAEAEAWGKAKPTGFPVGEKERTTWIDAYADLGRRCEKRDPDLLRHVSTTDTAQDLDLLRRAVGEEQLNYLGVSYGTILGATYANLFPDKVRAMVLDSNIDPKAWTNDARPDATTTTLLRMGSDRTAAATLDRFLDLCGSATTGRCAFSAGTAQGTRDKFDRLMQRLRERPVGPWTYAATVADTVSSLYIVDPGWTDLAARLQELWRGKAPKPPVFPAPPPVAHPSPYLGEEQAMAVWCGDSPNPRDPAVYRGLEEDSARRAGDAGRYWTWSGEPCATWPAEAANRYEGPWNTPTAHPVLVVGTRYDPSTSYADAEAMAKELAGARLLTHEGYGHTALFNNASSCVNAYESRYFVDGTLPPPGTKCQPDEQPFS